MNSKAHLFISLLKSAIRIAACILVLVLAQGFSVILLAVGFLIAEVLGIAEEIFDKR